MNIPFNKPYLTGKEIEYIQQAMTNGHFSGDGPYTKKCQKWLEDNIGCHKALLTPSCTAALEMAAILADIKPGDEVIMPSYTFASTANAFVLRGGVPVFIDIRPDTMNMDETLIEAAITAKTKAIVPVHYAAVACEMDVIMNIANRHGLLVIEDAAQAIMSTYKGKPLGSIGHLATLSFHETKNIHCGEGGALLINNDRFIERAEIIREKGTNRSKFFRGEVDKYTWVDIGSSYLPSEITAAFLYAQMESADDITHKRTYMWNRYYSNLKYLQDKMLLVLPYLPAETTHNGHLFNIRTSNNTERVCLLEHLKQFGINAIFHYIPLHSTNSGGYNLRLNGQDIYTTQLSECLIRLPLYPSISDEEIDFITLAIKKYFGFK